MNGRTWGIRPAQCDAPRCMNPPTHELTRGLGVLSVGTGRLFCFSCATSLAIQMNGDMPDAEPDEGGDK